MPDGYEPTDNGADDLALRQFLKGYSLIVSKNGKKYVTTIENSRKIQKIVEEIKNNTSTNTNTNVNSIKKPTIYNKTEEDIKKVGDGEAQDFMTSVVTSGAADSTYGDGYGYNKKADAIKKKLNCTTYTYSPNPKMKIVRRTFD